MARPKKKGVDYFPHDCTTGKTIFTLEQKFGNDGYAFWFKLLEFLGTKEGHFLDCNDIEDMEFLQAKTRLDEIMIFKILDVLSNLNAIDRELWQKKIIWSQRFVDGISDVYVNRRLDTPAKPSSYIVSTDDNPANPELSEQPTSKSTQSKVKKSIVKESKENTTVGAAIAAEPEKKEERKKKKPDSEPYWKELVTVYFGFCHEKFKEKPSFTGSDPSDMHRIIECLKKRAAERNVEWTEETAKLRWREFLGRAFQDDWLSKNFLLPNLYRQMDKVFLNLKNHKNGTYQQHASTIGQTFEPD